MSKKYKKQKKIYTALILLFITIAGVFIYRYYPEFNAQRTIKKKCINAVMDACKSWGDQSLITSCQPYKRCMRQKGDPTVYDLTDYGYIEEKNGEFRFVGVDNALKRAVKK